MHEKQGGDGLRGPDKRQDGLRDISAGTGDDLPEGLQRQPTHPVNPTTGRGNGQEPKPASPHNKN